jgi:hypothetical protein
MSAPEQVAPATDAKHDYTDEKKGTYDQNYNVKPVETNSSPERSSDEYDEKPKSRGRRFWNVVKEPGSAPQIVSAALIAVAIGMAVNATVDEVPDAAITIVGIPGRCWLRALTATGTPFLFITMTATNR